MLNYNETEMYFFAIKKLTIYTNVTRTMKKLQDKVILQFLENDFCQKTIFLISIKFLSIIFYSR